MLQLNGFVNIQKNMRFRSETKDDYFLILLNEFFLCQAAEVGNNAGCSKKYTQKWESFFDQNNMK